MPLMHGFLNLIMLAITIWCYWKILGKAGFSGWWAYLLILSLALTYFASAANSPVILIAPYIIPAAMIWVFAFIRWPSFELHQVELDSRYRRARNDLTTENFDDTHQRVNPRSHDGGEARGKRRRRKK